MQFITVNESVAMEFICDGLDNYEYIEITTEGVSDIFNRIWESIKNFSMKVCMFIGKMLKKLAALIKSTIQKLRAKISKESFEPAFERLFAPTPGELDRAVNKALINVEPKYTRVSYFIMRYSNTLSGICKYDHDNKNYNNDGFSDDITADNYLTHAIGAITAITSGALRTRCDEIARAAKKEKSFLFFKSGGEGTIEKELKNKVFDPISKDIEETISSKLAYSLHLRRTPQSNKEFSDMLTSCANNITNISDKYNAAVKNIKGIDKPWKVDWFSDDKENVRIANFIVKFNIDIINKINKKAAEYVATLLKYITSVGKIDIDEIHQSVRES